MTIQETLRNRYQRDQWQKILEEVFNKSAQRLSLISPTALPAAHDSVKQTLQLGNIKLDDGNTVAVLEIETTDQVKLARNRVGLRHFITSFIDQADATAVLAVFYQKDSHDWRLTYASKTTTLDEDTFEVVNIETAPKRFTYLLGNDEPCRTPAARLAKIRDNKEEIDLKTIELAFSVESLSKDFFKKYKEHYEKFTSYLLSTELADSTRANFEIETIANEAAQEKADKPVRDFIKTLLGRLVFLHFLQKKRWLSCSKDSRQWTDGDAQFLENYKQMAIDVDEADLFHSKYLCPLFFEALNQEDRSNDLFELTNTRIPYLNGGLFEEDADEYRDIDFPIHYFTELLDFFGEYNFTIDENDPEDHEVGIDPEMLGMIFENLLEDNKEKGTYYTPKAIVSYMSRQSLLHYLQTHLGENDELEKLLQEKDASNHQKEDSFVNQNREKIIKLLNDVTVCDPAIGSGAFPIGMLHEILWTMLTLLPEAENTSQKRAALKRQIIQNSIHGVDIDPGAIEIARLRFWLALVVDEDDPRPLPNLDYKIHRADSLIEYIRGEAVNLGTDTPTDATTKQAVNALIEAKKSLFTAQKRQEKRDAWFALYLALAHLAQAEFMWLRNKEGLFGSGEKAAQLDYCMKEFSQWISQIESIKNKRVHLQDTLLDRLKKWFDDSTKPTFLWNLHFGGAMAEGGFDIVIANPPYIGEDENKDLFQAIRTGHLAQYYRGKMDVFYFFIHLATDRLLKKKGVCYFITTSYFVTADGAIKLRKSLQEKASILELINFNELKIFKSAKGQHNLLYGISNDLPLNSFVKLATTYKEGQSTEAIVSQILNRKCPESVFSSRKQSSLFHGPNKYIQLATRSNSGEKQPLLQSILEKADEHRVLNDISKLNQGLVSGCDKVSKKAILKHQLLEGLVNYPIFIFDTSKKIDHDIVSAFSEEEKSFLRPFYKNSDIDNFITSTTTTKLVLYIDRSVIDIDSLDNIKNHLLKFKDILEQRREVKNGRMLWFQLQWPRTETLFTEPSIVIPYRAPRSIAAISSPPWFCRSDCYLVNTTEDEMFFLIAVLNSNFTSYWLGERGKKKGKTLELFPAALKQLPIPNSTKTDKFNLTRLAKKCRISATNKNILTYKSSKIEIDEIVYRLFDLTPEEIELIEITLAN